MLQPDRHPSRTAEFVALFRALETRLPADQRLFDDPYAQAFLGPRLGAVLALARVPLTGAVVTQAIDRAWPGARVSVVVRTRFIDDVLERALAGGTVQVVILGSGFDTRAYRIPGAAGAHILEVDMPRTLQGKRARIEALLGGLPPHVSMVATDFEREELAAALSRADFRRRAPTLFIWEGVTSYLSAVAIDTTLRRVAALAAPGSELAFTYLDQAALEGRRELSGARAAMATVRHVGEPFRSGFDPAELGPYLAHRGLTLLEDLTSVDLAACYLHPLGRRPVATCFYHVALAAR